MFSTFWIAQYPVSLCLNEIMYSLVFCFTLLWFQCILIWCCYFIKWFIPKRTTWPSCWAPGQLQVTLRSSCEYHTCSLGSGGWFFFLKFNILKFLHKVQKQIPFHFIFLQTVALWDLRNLKLKLHTFESHKDEIFQVCDSFLVSLSDFSNFVLEGSL